MYSKNLSDHNIICLSEQIYISKVLPYPDKKVETFRQGCCPLPLQYIPRIWKPLLQWSLTPGHTYIGENSVQKSSTEKSNTKDLLLR